MKSNQEARSRFPLADDWVALTWNDLEQWAGGRSVERGRGYQRGGRVEDLAITTDGALLATVVGTHDYATTVALEPGKALKSSCNCPVGANGCKHAVAVVAEYLQALTDGREVPTATDDDPRWHELNHDWTEGDNPWSKAEDRGEDDDKIERHIRAKPHDELVDLVCSLARRFPEIRQEFRERIALQEGNVGKLVAETRREIKRVTSEDAWLDSWTDEGHIPDYDKIRHRFERLLELGHADEVVSLGREFISRGVDQVSEAHDDEGEIAEVFSESLPVIFQAVARSSLSGSERLLFAIDVLLDDDNETIGDAVDVVFEAPASPEDWSAVADELAGRLKGFDATGEEFSSNYRRDQLTGWIAEALDEAGRGDELQPLYESEARITKNYKRLVDFLLDRGQVEDAERWAREGIAATVEKLPGIATDLSKKLCQLAEKRGRWDEIAARAALKFFADYPGVSSFEALMEAAEKAGVEKPVRAAALRFLETGAMPYKLTRAGGRGGATRSSLKIDPDWPLPMPDYLIPFLERPGGYDSKPRPRWDILLSLAIADKNPDETLRWFDKMREARGDSGSYSSGGGYGYGDRVAEAVAATHPERALAIYTDALNARLPHAEIAAYQSATNYLKKMRPLYEALNRADEWDALVASIREQYRRRPRFMELLDGLEDRPIIESARRRK